MLLGKVNDRLAEGIVLLMFVLALVLVWHAGW